MEQENIPSEQMPNVEYQDRKIRKRTFSILFLIASILLSIFGLYKMYAAHVSFDCESNEEKHIT